MTLTKTSGEKQKRKRVSLVSHSLSFPVLCCRSGVAILLVSGNGCRAGQVVRRGEGSLDDRGRASRDREYRVIRGVALGGYGNLVRARRKLGAELAAAVDYTLRYTVTLRVEDHYVHPDHVGSGRRSLSIHYDLTRPG